MHSPDCPMRNEKQPLADALPLLPLSAAPGLYRHYKGNLYEVVDTVRHSETLEALTLYRALYGERGLWVRPAAMFLENVEVNGVLQPRFTRLGPAETP